MNDSSPAMPSGKKNKKPDQWEVDNWVDTLHKAEEIKNDPHKMKHALPALKKKHGALGKVMKSVAELRAHAAKMDAAEKETPEEDKAENGMEE